MFVPFTDVPRMTVALQPVIERLFASGACAQAECEAPGGPDRTCNECLQCISRACRLLGRATPAPAPRIDFALRHMRRRACAPGLFEEHLQ